MRIGRLCHAVYVALKERAAARAQARSQAGFSATELLVFTAPLCVLSMVLASKLAATSSAHIRAGWQASLAAQQAATKPCGGNPKLNAPFHPETDEGVLNSVGLPMLVVSEAFGQTVLPKVATIFEKQNRVFGPLTKNATRAQNIASNVSGVIGAVNIIATILFTVISFLPLIPDDILTSPELVESNWAIRSATAPIAPYHFQRQADALISGPPSVTASATFLCNEPDGGDKVRDEKRDYLVGMAVMEANSIYF